MARDANGPLKVDVFRAFMSFFALYFSTTDKCQKLTNQTASLGKSKTQAKRMRSCLSGRNVTMLQCLRTGAPHFLLIFVWRKRKSQGSLLFDFSADSDKKANKHSNGDVSGSKMEIEELNTKPATSRHTRQMSLFVFYICTLISLLVCFLAVLWID